MNRFVRTYTTWAACLLLVTALAAGNSGYTLCVGADNRVEVESVCQPCCGSTDSDKNAVSVDEHADHDGCFDCTDLTFTHNLYRHVPTLDAPDASFRGPVSSVAPLPMNAALNTSRASACSPAPSGGIAACTTGSRCLDATVLRC